MSFFGRVKDSDEQRCEQILTWNVWEETADEDDEGKRTGYSLIPPSAHDELRCMILANGNSLEAQTIYHTWAPSKVYKQLALQRAAMFKEDDE